ncbi:MAG: L-aspartate oxidase [Lysinibacillus sp.]|nr:L-aspartate oxidase [Lysinibacillus sp.]
MIIKTDIVIIGSGVAALQSAKVLSKKFQVHIITKSDIKNGSSYKAQGGIAAVTSEDDETALHFQDTIAAGEHHHAEMNVQTLVEEGKIAIQQLIHEQFPVDRHYDGKIMLGLEGAHSKQRIVHSGGDATGKTLVNYLIETLPKNVTIHEFEMAYELLLNIEGECVGVKTKTNKENRTYFASYVIVATGGAGALYEYTSNCPDSFGDGIALSYLAGANIADMEFFQFHPSLIYVDGQTRGLASEAVRGEGGFFVDEKGNRIMDGVHPLGDLAPRHITAFEIYKKRAEGHEVYIDISNIEHFEEKFPTITGICIEHGIDLTSKRIPIAPGSHFLMGGIVSDAYGRTSIPRLLAVGETACTGVHGANRLASNSLLEGITFGKLMAEELLQKGTIQKNFNVMKKAAKSIDVPSLFTRSTLQKEMIAKAGIVRNEEGLSDLLKKLPSFEQVAMIDLDSLGRETIEGIFMHVTASLIVEAALIRKESRGAHIRKDYPEKSREWQQQWIVFNKGNYDVRDGLYEQYQTTKNARAVF